MQNRTYLKSFENVSFTEYPICTFVDVCTLCSNQRFYICAIYEYLSCQFDGSHYNTFVEEKKQKYSTNVKNVLDIPHLWNYNGFRKGVEKWFSQSNKRENMPG